MGWSDWEDDQEGGRCYEERVASWFIRPEELEGEAEEAQNAGPGQPHSISAYIAVGSFGSAYLGTC